MIKDIVDSVKELDLSEHKPEVLTALLTGTTVASFMYISNARSVQKTAMNITKGVIQESEESYQKRLADEVRKLKEVAEKNEMKVKKTYEEDILRLKNDIESKVSNYNAQKQLLDRVEEEKKKLEASLDNLHVEVESMRKELQIEFDKQLQTYIDNNNDMLDAQMNNMKKQHDVITEQLNISQTEQIVNIRQSYEIKVSALTDQIKEIHVTNAMKIEHLEHTIDQLNQQIDKLNYITSQHEETVTEKIKLHREVKETHDRLLETHKKTYNELKDFHHNEVTNVKNMHNDQLKEMEDTIRRKEEDLDTIKAKHDSLLKLKDEELKQLKILHDNHVSKVHERHEEVIQNMQEIHENTVKFKVQQHDEKVQDLNNRIDTHVLSKEEELQRLKALHEEHVQILSSRHEDVLSEVEIRHAQHKEEKEKEFKEISKELNTHIENNMAKQGEIDLLKNRINNVMNEKNQALNDYENLKLKYQKLEIRLNEEKNHFTSEKKVLLDALNESRKENKLKNEDITNLNKELKLKLEAIKTLEENSRRDARKSVESVKKLQLMRKEMEAKMKVMQDQHEIEIAEQTKSYSDQLLKVYAPVRLEDEKNPEARCSLFIAMLLAGNTICTGPGAISERRLVTFLEQVNSPLFSSLNDATNLANQLIIELNSNNSDGIKNRTVQVSQFAEYILSKLSHHPTSLEKLRTIALASYLKLGLSPRNSPIKGKLNVGSMSRNIAINVSKMQNFAHNEGGEKFS